MKPSTDQNPTEPATSDANEATWSSMLACAVGAGGLAGYFGIGAAVVGTVAGGLFGLFMIRRDAK